MLLNRYFVCFTLFGAGADGSVRMFDLRHLEHSTIIYEDPQHHPLLRLGWNKQDPNYLATMAMDALEVNVYRVSPPGISSGVSDNLAHQN